MSTDLLIIRGKFKSVSLVVYGKVIEGDSFEASIEYSRLTRPQTQQPLTFTTNQRPIFSQSELVNDLDEDENPAGMNEYFEDIVRYEHIRPKLLLQQGEENNRAVATNSPARRAYRRARL